MATITSSSITLAELMERFGVDRFHNEAGTAADTYPFRITRYYAGLIQRPGDPVWRQSVPSSDELKDISQHVDPLDEERLSPVPGLIHRYPDRVVLLASNRCMVYCRFCMRKRKVGSGPASVCLDSAIEYISATESINDVLISGGDPLTLPVDELNGLLKRLRRIPHVAIIRIGSRIPVVEPSIITPELCRMLASHHPVYLNTHFNHPMELTPEAFRACEQLANAGILLGNQTVLLKGVNDDYKVLAELFTGLLKMRVRPYYLHQMDLVRGTAHFRTPLAEGMKMMQALRGKISGMAIPHFVVDLPGGKGKVPLLSEAASLDADGWKIRACSGEVVSYNDLPTTGPN